MQALLDRSRLNRADPRLSAGQRVTWFPLAGNLVNHGDVVCRGTVPDAGGATWVPSPTAGTYLRFPSGARTYDNAKIPELYAESMGIVGAAPRTVFADLAFRVPAASSHSYFVFGTGLTGQDFSLRKDNATLSIEPWGGGGSSFSLSGFNVGGNNGLIYLRFVSVYRGANTPIRQFARVMRTDGQWGGYISASGGNVTLNTSSAGAFPLFRIGNTNWQNNQDGDSGLAYLGLLGGYAWSDSEIEAFLRDPNPLWTEQDIPVVGRRNSGGGAQTYNDTIDGAVSLADSLSATATFQTTVADSAALADSLNITSVRVATVTDGVSLSDSLNLTSTRNVSVSDSVGLTDVFGVTSTRVTSISESITLADALGVTSTRVTSISDNVTLTDDFSSSVNAGAEVFNDTISDSISVTDGLTVTSTRSVTISDSVALADSFALTSTRNAVISDSVTLSDAHVASAIFGAATADSIVLADAAAALLQGNASISDSVILNDGTQVALSISEMLSDDVGLGDIFTTDSSQDISFVAANSAESNTVSIPAHQSGDLILVFAYNKNSNTLPGTPAGFERIGNGASGNTNAAIVAWQVSDGTPVSVTTTSTTHIGVAIYRGVTRLGASVFQGRNAVFIDYNALTLQQDNGEAWVVVFGGHKTGENLQIAPNGTVNRTNTGSTNGEIAIHDTDGGVATFSFQRITVSGSSAGSFGYVVELRNTPVYNDNLYDDLAFFDTIDVNNSLAQSISETVTLSDGISLLSTFGIAVQDGITLLDDVTSGAIFRPSIQDGLTLGDSVVGVKLVTGSIGGAITLTDSLSVASSFFGPISDQILVGDAFTATGNYITVLADSILLTDNILGIVPAIGVLEDVRLTVTLLNKVSARVTAATPVQTSVGIARPSKVTVRSLKRVLE